MYTLLHGLYKHLVQKDEYCVLILGLDNAGKTTYLEATKTKFTKKYKAMNANRITTTVGLNIGKIDVDGVRLNFWDLGGQQELQSLWDKYYAECHAVIYIVDSSDRERVSESKETFEISVGAGEAAGEHSLQQPHLSCAETARSIHTLLTPINSAEIVPTPCQILKIMLYGFWSYKGTLMRLLESTCSLESSLLMLHNDRMIASEHLSGVPLLVLANKQDIPDCMGVHTVKPIFNQNAHLIGARDIMLMATSALTGDGVDEGIRWLVDCIKRNSVDRPSRNHEDPI